MENSDIIFRVAKDTEVKKLASAIFSNLKNTNSIILTCVGIASVNQAIKAVISARGSSVENGFDIASYPSFSSTIIEGEEKTSINLRLKKESL